MTTKVYPHEDANLPAPDWNPVEDEFYTDFINNLQNFDAESKKTLTKESLSILGKCINPQSTEKSIINTGSVIGYVQSGKTTSFNALAILAIDNGFKFIIVLGGRTNNLLNQNREEFEKNLSFMLDDSKVKLPPSDIGSIASLNLTCLTDNGDHFPAKPIISVNLKHQGHIRKLTNVLKKYKAILAEINVLIIDDEADNASLNSMVSSDDYDESAVYGSIKEMRAWLPRHSYVQYTATPQALLLISKSDEMSPQWVRFITPGKDYVGTKEFFHDSHATVSIPPEQLLGKDIQNFELPESLFKALYTYFITAAQSRITGSPVWPKNITMMIHPHGETKVQDKWGETINEYLDDWRYEIEINDSNWRKEHRNGFMEAYSLLQDGANEIDTFEKLYDLVPNIVQFVSLSVLNSKKNDYLLKTVNWKDNDYNIVVGGNLLDRGFVVKGLVTTYMPRKGSVNSDTLQQRGRFYGYKRKHLGFLKLWMGSDTIRDFKEYLDSEDFLYKDLKSWTQNNPDKSLQEWTRRMVLSADLEPCRKAIIGIGLVPKFLNKNGWFWPKNPSASKYNEAIIEGLINSCQNKFSSYENSENWSSATKSLIAEGVDLKGVIDLICDYDVGHADAPQWATIKLSLELYTRKHCNAAVVLMGTESTGLDDFHSRKRSLTEQEVESSDYDDTTGQKYKKKALHYNLNYLHQGKTIKTGYPGAEKISSKCSNTITFQIHKIFIEHPGDSSKSYESLVLAIKMPRNANIITEA